jgi:DNA replication initiation complex subunit (GINS family)
MSSESSGGNVYRETLELWNSERGSPHPIKIPDRWIRSLKDHAEDLRINARLAVNKDSINTRLLSGELEILSKMVEDLLRRRLRKIIDAALEGRRLENLLPVEAELYEKLQLPLTSYREYIEHVKYSLDLTAKKVESSARLVVVFVKPAPAIVDSDGVARGPFPEGAVASLDPPTARLLEQGGYVKILPTLKTH